MINNNIEENNNKNNSDLEFDFNNDKININEENEDNLLEVDDNNITLLFSNYSLKNNNDKNKSLEGCINTEIYNGNINCSEIGKNNEEYFKETLIRRID